MPSAPWVTDPAPKVGVGSPYLDLSVERPLPVSYTHLDVYKRQQLSGFKVPDTVTFSDELPRTATGKVRKNLLRN